MIVNAGAAFAEGQASYTGVAKTHRLRGTRQIDEAVLDRLVDRILLTPSLRRASARIRRQQRRLRGLVGDVAWRAYLAIER